MLGFCPLASGSRGNALYLGTEKVKVLIDAGISLKDLTARLAQIHVQIQDIGAVLITHEHIDHIRGLSALCRKWNIPVFANRETAKAIVEAITFIPKFKIFSTGEAFRYGDLKIVPFPVQHDAIEPVAFTFHVDGGAKVGVCADLGFVTTLVQHHLQHCDYLYVEANHQPSMVHACSRPLVYKQRVLSRQGHLSNEESAKLISHVHTDRLKHVYLAHLSSECNAPELALQTVKDTLEARAQKVSLSIAWQDEISQPVDFRT
ncbi:MAG: MBL fold metallo-hydrolase, partial [Chlamydiae bacterium]|nr:MBL fold metallo-hydrolase [Chlamydiota bacterium]